MLFVVGCCSLLAFRFTFHYSFTICFTPRTVAAVCRYVNEGEGRLLCVLCCMFLFPPSTRSLARLLHFMII